MLDWQIWRWLGEEKLGKNVFFCKINLKVKFGITNLAAMGIFWRKQTTNMISFYDVSEMRKSLIDFLEMRPRTFLG